ncbi:hypothetical protein GCM10023086_53360 [Streptomyces venetus]|uniref:Uncharacterized protein n=1 Tax=Streptomyces venetus TaxID=1701086 RepID=A0ABP8GKD7_9ACTN
MNPIPTAAPASTSAAELVTFARVRCIEWKKAGAMTSSILEGSLAGAQDTLAQLDAGRARQSAAVDLAIPTFRDIAGRGGASPG